MGWVSWPLYIFMFLASFSALWWPNMKMGFQELLKKLFAQFISYLASAFMGLVSWPLPIHLRVPSLIFVPLVAKCLAEMGFPELFEKTIGSIHFIPVIYPYGVSLLTTIHFRVPSLIFGSLVAKYLAKNGVSGTFWKNYWLNSFHTWHLPLWDEFLDPYTFLCSYQRFIYTRAHISSDSWQMVTIRHQNITQNSSYK